MNDLKLSFLVNGTQQKKAAATDGHRKKGSGAKITMNVICAPEPVYY
ncbi:hypothetical protein [Peribacillus butanolivorans]